MIQIEIKADSRYPVDKKKIRQQIQQQLEKAGIEDGVELSVLIVGNRKMRTLTKTFLKKREDHSVLAFPQEENKSGGNLGFVTPAGESLQLGDVVVCYPQALKQAIIKNRLIDEEIAFLIDHGVGHLLGETHD